MNEISKLFDNALERKEFRNLKDDVLKLIGNSCICDVKRKGCKEDNNKEKDSDNNENDNNNDDNNNDNDNLIDKILNNNDKLHNFNDNVINNFIVVFKIRKAFLTNI